MEWNYPKNAIYNIAQLRQSHTNTYANLFMLLQKNEESPYRAGDYRFLKGSFALKRHLESFQMLHSVWHKVMIILENIVFEIRQRKFLVR